MPTRYYVAYVALDLAVRSAEVAAHCRMKRPRFPDVSSARTCAADPSHQPCLNSAAKKTAPAEADAVYATTALARCVAGR
jgi:hypothetical protein